MRSALSTLKLRYGHKSPPRESKQASLFLFLTITQEIIPFSVVGSEKTIVVNGSAPEASEPSAPGEDKQELERQRLLDQTSAPSAPPEEPNGIGSGNGNVNGTGHGEPGEGPSAPVFDEDDQLVGGTAHADESLPRYQR